MLKIKIARYRLMEEHLKLVKDGRYTCARIILGLLINGGGIIDTGSCGTDATMDKLHVRALCDLFGCEVVQIDLFKTQISCV